MKVTLNRVFSRIGRLSRSVMPAWWRAQTAALLVLAILSIPERAQAEAAKLYVFGNSLIYHASETEKTSVPYWLGYLARRNGEKLQLDGQWGFMRNFAKDLPPNPQWGFSNVQSAWRRGTRDLADNGYTHVMFNPANFIQYQGAEVPYDGENPTGETPLSTATDLFQKVPHNEIILYEGWADLAAFSSRFPPRDRPLRKYHAFNAGDYHDWYVDFAEALQQEFPQSNITLLPVARILSRAFTETGLKDLEATDIYLDDAPHGTKDLYFLASVPVYAQLFGSLPSAVDVPAEVHPLIKEHFADFLAIIEEEVSFEQASAVVPAPAQPANQETKPTQIAEVEGYSPALGYGLDGISDWSTQVPFVDLMKSSRRWVGHVKGQFGGWDDEDLRKGGYLDAEGWPTAIPNELSKIETYMLTDFPEDALQNAGVYRLSWDGEGKIDLAGRPRALRYGDNEIWFQFSPGDGVLGIAISQTDPAGVGDYIRNVSVVREDQIPLYEAGAVFNPEWLSVVEDVRLVRFMDWMFTNGSGAETWENRPLISDYTYAYRGVPMELMVDLVNQIGADPWFNMPHKADDTYVRNFAEYVHQNLRPGLKAHMEYSNEVWNFLFPQTHWAVAQAEMLWDENPEGDVWMQFYGHRAAQMATIWSDVFADDMQRLERVVAVHTGWPGLEQAALKAPLAVKAGAIEPVELFDAYAVTGYFGLEYGSEERAPEVLDWIAESQLSGQGYALANQRLAADVKENGLRELTQELWPYHSEVAAEHDLDLMMYEGGTHIVGHDVWTNEEDLTAFFKAFNYSPEMGALYETLLTAWDAVGGTEFNAFVDVAKPTKWGSWGARRHLGDSNARLEALQAYNHAGAKWGAQRDAHDFRAGVFLEGSDAADVLTGTDVTDVLIAGKGDDELLPDLGLNYLHGGGGNDHAVLPGFLEEYRFNSEGARLIAASAKSTTHLYAIETLSFSETPDLILSTSDLF